MINFTVEIKPTPYARPRFGKFKQVFDPPNYANFKTALKFAAHNEMRKLKLRPTDKPVKVTLDFYKNNRNLTSKNWGDIDNHCKAVFDALNNVCFFDDSQVVSLVANKFFSKNEKIVINIEVF